MVSLATAPIRFTLTQTITMDWLSLLIDHTDHLQRRLFAISKSPPTLPKFIHTTFGQRKAGPFPSTPGDRTTKLFSRTPGTARVTHDPTMKLLLLWRFAACQPHLTGDLRTQLAFFRLLLVVVVVVCDRGGDTRGFPSWQRLTDFIGRTFPCRPQRTGLSADFDRAHHPSSTIFVLFADLCPWRQRRTTTQDQKGDAHTQSPNHTN